MKKSGFTLVEVLLAVSFLALGTLLIQEGFLRAAGLYGRYANTMRASVWMNEHFWNARETALFSNAVPAPETGEFTSEGVPFLWSLNVDSVPAAKNLYALKLTVQWNEGSRPVTLIREVYATKPVQPS